MSGTKNILFFILLFSPFAITAQIQMDKSGRPDRSDREMKRKEEKIESVIKVWNLDGDGASIKENNLDTLQDYYHIFNPIYKDAITNTFTGNYSGAYLNNNFFKRKYNNDFFFLNTHDAYLLTPKNVLYYNTTTPYTLLDYSQSEKQNTANETRFNVLHTQNVNEKLNLTFRYDQAKSEGQYESQAAKNHFVSLYSNYISDKLNIHGGFIVNKISNDEHGGMVNDADLINPDITLKEISLINANSSYNNSYYYTTAEYKVGKYIKKDEEEEEIFKPIIGFIYSFEMSNNRRFFTEEEVDFNYFPETYLDSVATGDTTRFTRVTNMFQIKQYETPEKKASFGKRAYIGADIIRTSYQELLYDDRPKNKYTNLFVGGGLSREAGNFWKWDAEGRLYITGYRSGQTELKASIWKPINFFKDTLASIKIDGNIENIVPDYFQQNYGGNHIRWNNRLNNEQRMRAGFTFASPKRHLEAGVKYELINNFIYNDTTGIPTQTKKELLILGAYINKDFVLKNFHIRTKLLAQKASSDEFIHLPDLSALLGVYYRFIWSKVLHTQLGFDVRYNTAYYADAFDPSTGLFYLQDEKEIGNYPYIDAYASLKLKRTRVFFKYMNVGSGFLDKEYFTALHYPMNAMTFRLGVAWSFYD